MTTFTIKKAKGLPSQEFETITDAIYFLTLHGLKPKKGAVDDDLDWTKETEKNKKAYEESKKRYNNGEYSDFEDLKKQFYQKFPQKEHVYS